MAQALTLWAPNLLNSLRVKEAQEALEKISLPGLQTLLAKGDFFQSKPQSFHQQASYLFHQTECLPIAATQASIELNSFDASHFWISVDPVQMIPDRDTLVLIPGKSLQITEDESKQLLTAFNEHFAEDGVQLVWANTHHWYLSIVQAVDLHTTELEKVSYQSVNPYYPTGNAAQYWRQLLNETQMLFYTHPVNEARREQGLPEINSVWVWGEGKIDFSKLNIRQDAAIWSDEPYLQGMAKLTQAQAMGFVPNYQAWLNQLEPLEDKAQSITKHLVHLDQVAENLEYLQMSEWIELLEQLETQWFAPLVQALKEGSIDSLLLDLGQESRVHLKPSHLKRFWRFKKKLS
ncbi:hypothetical protein [Thiomicrorhabdus sp.]|uniref:hypothetical protein n=1 Tax=Thiomicrorhabdus sp. TaxID=2039724 RepID=UPI002AA8DF9D|nr:hypothetical protein [Thiomicrorhabdus sp.]